MTNMSQCAYTHTYMLLYGNEIHNYTNIYKRNYTTYVASL